ncbi:MAG TPA: alkaline phosphatase family protein [Candidatus Polarisedimenticolaceae bacterium]
MRRLALAALLLFLPACSTPSTGTLPPSPDTKVLVVGLDGADWEILDRLERDGRIPNLSRLRREGAWGVLRAENPLLSPIVWTSIATGRHPEDHGIVGFLTKRDGVEEPVRSDERRVRAFWNVATEQGLSVGVVGWYASWPAEPVRGFLVSDRAGSHQIAGGATRATTGLAHPPEVAAEIERARGEVDRAIGDAHAMTFFGPGSLAPDPEKLETFVGILRTTELYRRLAPELIRRYRPTIAAVYLEGTDAVGHLFGEYQPPRLPWASDAEVARFGPVWDAYYAEADRVVGDVLASVDPAKTTVLVVSDHGFKVGPRRPRLSTQNRYGNQAPLSHRAEGIVVAWGRGVKGPGEIPEASVYDVFPTIARLAGLPLAENLVGRSIDAAFVPGTLAEPIRTVPDYETAGERAKGEAGDIPGEDETIAKLRALGYVGGAPGAERAAGGPTQGQAAVPLNRYNMALILAARGKREEALRVIRELQRDAPTFTLGWVGEGLVLLQMQRAAEAIVPLQRAVKLAPDLVTANAYLAEAYVKAGRREEALRGLERTLALDASDPRTALFYAQILIQDRRVAEAERWFRAAYELGDVPSDRARACVGLAVAAEERRDLVAAERSYAKALELDPSLPGALERFGNLRLYQRRFADAIGLFDRLVTATGGNAASHILRARALAIAGRRAEAREALRLALAKDPTSGEAKALLRELDAGS